MATSELLCLLVAILPAAVLCRAPLHQVIGGSDAADGAYPWQLSLRNMDSHSCGASLISSRVAVCAAHCVGSAPSVYTLVAGTNQRSCPNSDCLLIRPSAIVRHENFTNSGAAGNPNDVSVLSWDEPIMESDKVKFISITESEDWVGKECYITGWGRTSGNSGTLPENLREAAIDVLTNTECRRMWSSNQIHDSHVCVYDNANRARGACNGDSGGPLICRSSENSPWELIGAMSWLRAGCSTAYPSVCSRLSSFKDWIESQYPS